MSNKKLKALEELQEVFDVNMDRRYFLKCSAFLGVPACALHHGITALDLVLPRILAGEHIGKTELAFLGHGGLCRDCPECSYPRCSFGKGT